MRRLMMFAAIAALGCAGSASAKIGGPADLKTAVAASSRTADNVKLDVSRKPEAVLRWAGLRQGMRVLDLFGSNLYWAEIVAPAVGASGHVTIWEPDQFFDDKGKAGFAAFQSKHKNVDLVSSPMETPKLPAKAFDFAILNLDYHDVYWQSDEYKIARMEPQTWLKAINQSLKQGATVLVIDHVGKAGDTRAIVEKYHRIDPAVVRADFRRAGFALVASSELLRNPADDHELLVFDPKIRGKTDRFVYKFRKVR